MFGVYLHKKRFVATLLQTFFFDQSSNVFNSTIMPTNKMNTMKNEINIKTISLNSYQVLNPSDPGGAW